MYFALTVVLVFIAIGYTLKSLLNHSLRNVYRISLQPYFNIPAPAISKKDAYFDPLKVRIFPGSNAGLEAIFDIIIDRYILSWYNTFSDNDDFVVQVRLHLQHLSAALINRANSVPLSSFIWDDFLKLVVSHVEHILPLLYSEEQIDSVVEEVVLRSLSPHLHVSLTSRHSELMYLRALVNRVLPYISLPPALISNSDQPDTRISDFQSFKSQLLSPKRKVSYPLHGGNASRESPFARSISTGVLLSKSPPAVKLGANRAAYSFLVEILSTCVLLPAMDAIANPDFINRVLLQCLAVQTIPEEPIIGFSEKVPVLSSYVTEWKRWTSEKPTFMLGLEKLLDQPESCFPLIQYMKSVKSTIPVTAVLLMHEIDQRVRNGPLPPDARREVRAQIHHVLILVRHSRNPTAEDDALFAVGDFSAPCSDNLRLFDLSEEFEQLLVKFLKTSATTSSLFNLVDSPVWSYACRQAYEAVGVRFLPLFVESPEYLLPKYGRSLSLSSLSSSASNSPKHVSSSSSGLFGFPLKTIFANNVVEGKLLSSTDQELPRAPVQLHSRPQRGVSGRSSNFRMGVATPLEHGNALTIDSQHQLHSHYLLKAPRQIDMSDWHVFIPGLSKPEIRPSRRLIDQLVVPNGPATTSNGDSRSVYSTRPHDGAFRDRITSELNTLQSNDNRTPLLSPQFLFTVRTERMVNGVWQPIERVDRKYSEFYVLEQKLLEFHGTAITRQLPRKQFTPRTFEFLETKREPFEEYLQYLLAQPFLRSSELLHGFLTSKSTFSSNVLFELNIGRFAKSVPLKLIRERGQYLDNFLVSFYLSCNPQPILLEPLTSELNRSNAVAPIAPGSGVGTLGGIDTLASPDDYSVCPASRQANLPPADNNGPVTAPAVATQSRSAATSLPVERRRPKRTWLDNRLRMKMFWNNAGLNADRRREHRDMACDCVTIDFDSIVELPIFALKKLIQPLAHFPEDLSSDNNSASANSASDLATSLPPPLEDPLPEQPRAVHPWDIGHNSWGEALLNGPTSIPEKPPPGSSSAPLKDDDIHPSDTPDSQQAKLVTSPAPPSVQPTESVSIGLTELYRTFWQLIVVLKQHVLIRTRQFSLWVLCFVHRYFKSSLDRWVAACIERCMVETLTDSFIASGLQLLKSVLFYPYVPSTELEKVERKLQANHALKDFISHSRLAFLLDSEYGEKSVDRLFTCFQHPKWNKQLSYVLLDRLMLALFPELSDDLEQTPSEE